MRACEICCRILRPNEEIVCDPCEAARIRGLLGSRAWMRVRGSTRTPDGRRLADVLRGELVALESRRARPRSSRKEAANA